MHGGPNVVQFLERAALCFDHTHLKNNPSEAGNMFLLHLNDPAVLRLVLAANEPASVLFAGIKAVLAAVQQLVNDAAI